MGKREAPVRRGNLTPCRRAGTAGRAAIIAWVASVLLVLAIPAWAKQAKGNPYASARICATCHDDIYRMWERSVHAMSLTDPVFEVAFMQALRLSGEVRDQCLRCHAPITRVTRDFDLRDPVSREGVTCDFCHTIAAVNMGNRREPYAMMPGSGKFGPYQDVTSPAHPVYFSRAMENSALCGGCHEWVAKNGTILLGTYSEWKDSPYAAKGVQCQDCHMPTVKEATTVKPGVKPSEKRVNKHDLQGGHSEEQLRQAAKVEILDVTRGPEAVIAVVRVTNVGSGHMIPTGIPTRKLLLTARLKGPRGDILRESLIRYQKVLADGQGNPVDSDADILVKPVTVLLDNRLAPLEARTERFVFPVGKDIVFEETILHRTYPRNFSVEVTLTYSYTPLILKPADMLVEMAQATRSVP